MKIIYLQSKFTKGSLSKETSEDKTISKLKLQNWTVLNFPGKTSPYKVTNPQLHDAIFNFDLKKYLQTKL